MDQAGAIVAGRSGLKMSQEHLATAAGISARTVVRAESGLRVSGESLRSICAVLGLDSSRIAPVQDLPVAGKDESKPQQPQGIVAGTVRQGATVSVEQPGMRLRDLPLRMLGLRKTPILILLSILTAFGWAMAFAPVLDRMIGIDDVRRWTLEIQPSRVVATHLNAMASGKVGLKPPALSYFACSQNASGLQLYRAILTEDDCGFMRYEILVETSTLADGTLQTTVGPVGREFGRDLARRLSGDPKIRWSVAFASGRQAQGLAWFDPRAVPAQDMPRPPDSPSTWVYVGMSKKGAGR